MRNRQVLKSRGVQCGSAVDHKRSSVLCYPIHEVVIWRPDPSLESLSVRVEFLYLGRGPPDALIQSGRGAASRGDQRLRFVGTSQSEGETHGDKQLLE